ncbi:CoA-binding protein [Radiobacillus kanasensis]|uniref:CoA-binding protein n=1 Tax=Radiobacillus kanasensis TaxID=2844358 RepID=UPI001E60D242|nr:CoA-binding protein [Radiobacillus kanasensis]UFU01154.1 CoA-binding protein [Radiobacillus kanasensis]
MEHHPNKETLKEILENNHTIAVVGLSDRPNRTSYQIAKAMQAAGYRIIPVNPEITESLGEKAYPRLTDVDEPIDIINVFRRPEYLPDLAKEAVQTNAKVFWAQQGIWNEEAYQYLTEHDFTVVMDLCIKVAHSLTIGKN